MIEFRWNRIAVMAVDDNTFMRRLLTSTLNAFGVKTVIQESECSSAIERLRLSRTDPMEAKLGEVDLILSDYVMPGIDGNLFLRWVRMGEGTPNRFVPFILVSGAANRSVVEEVRDSGVSAVLAKPFSVNSMAERILWVVNSANDFILARQYFGPDRRRMNTPVKVDRRGDSQDDIQIVKPTSKARTLRDDVRAIHFLPDNRLRAKLGVRSPQEIVEFDPQVLRAAEARIQDMLGDYVDWVAKYLDDMRASLAAIKVGPKPIPENRVPVGSIGRIAY
ncbi:MAG: response regulator, partial [Kiloniellaceae bacterium]